MRNLVMSLLAILFFSNSIYADQGEIIIELEIDEPAKNYEYKLLVAELDTLFLHKLKEYKFKRRDNLFTLTIPTNKPIILTGSSKLPFPNKTSFLLSPGDSIRITSVHKSLSFSGKGSEVFILLKELNDASRIHKSDSLTKRAYGEIPSLKDYFSIIDQFGDFEIQSLNILSKFKKKISPVSNAYFQSVFMSRFYVVMGYGLMNLVRRRNSLNLSSADLSVIYDSVVNRYGALFIHPIDTLQITPLANAMAGNYARVSYLRSILFQVTDQDIENWASVYYFAKFFYSGLAQRRALTRIVTFRIITESSLSYDDFEVIKDFMSLPGYPEFKNYVANYFHKSLGYSIESIPPVDMYTDGPYVFHEDSVLVVKSVDVINKTPIGREYTIPTGKLLRINVNPGNGLEPFEVKIKPELRTEISEFEQPSKVLAISDMEGNFKTFKEFLQANNVIDENLNWTFGSGHLVLVGDFVDRGEEVTELLWLIYSLEEKAQAQNGYVHFLLGNHEIMNLSGSTRYVHIKYKHTAKLLEEDYSTGLYGVHSELGRWLRTKNIAEKIGNVLYVHGGISSAVNKLQLPLSTMNELVRRQYGREQSASQDDTLKVLISSKTAPYWYRGYYQKETSESQIDSSLAIFEVDKIVTGHTLLQSGKEITSHFSGKVINIDTHHAEGFTEALLIENNRYYQVNNQEGKVYLLLPGE